MFISTAVDPFGLGGKAFAAGAQQTGPSPRIVSVTITSTGGGEPVVTPPVGEQSKRNSFCLSGDGHLVRWPQGIPSRNYWPEGIYGIGDTIEITVAFDMPVTVSGAPGMNLSAGEVSRVAEYATTDETQLTFTYTVAEGDEDNNGVAIPANALSLQGGSIAGNAGQNAVVAHDPLTDQADHKVDGIRPWVAELFVPASTKAYQEAYSLGDEVFADIVWSEPTVFSLNINPLLKLDIGGTIRFAEHPCWLHETWWFSYHIQQGDFDEDGFQVVPNSLHSPDGGWIRDLAGNDADLTHGPTPAKDWFRVDTLGPTVSSIAITSNPGTDNTYDTGDKIEVTVTFNEDVLTASHVVCGDPENICKPHLELQVGSTTRVAKQQSNDGPEVAFAYTVQAGDADENGISIGANSLYFVHGYFIDLVGNSAIPTYNFGFDPPPVGAAVSHEAVADDARHKVAGSMSPLTLSGPGAMEIQENDEQSLAWYRVSGTDQDITWSLSGDDGDLFSLQVAQQGSDKSAQLRFQSPPNYEDPQDADGDNQYRVTIVASNGAATSHIQAVVLVSNAYLDSDEVPFISGAAQVGRTLMADLSRVTLSDQHTFKFAWIRSDGTTDTFIEDTSGYTSPSYTLTPDDEGNYIRVRVFRQDYLHWGGEDGFVDTEAVGPVVPSGQTPNTSATGAPTVTGMAQVGETLTADTSGIADANGLTNVSYSYQWLSSDGAEIPGATNSTYELKPSDANGNIQVRVSFTDDAGYPESLTSPEVGPVEVPVNSPATGRPVVTGTTQVGNTLTVDISGIADADGLTNVSYSYRWLAGSGGEEIPGATGSTYELQPSDATRNVQVWVSFTDDAGNPESLPSLEVGPVTRVANIPATGAPVIIGTAQVGHTLTVDTSGIADANGITNASFSYVWYSDGGSTIHIASDPTNFELVPANVNQVFFVSVSFTDDAGHFESLSSAPTPAVAAAALQQSTTVASIPTINGTVKVGHVLTADTSAISVPDGMDNASFGYQWLADDIAISGATGSRYVLKPTEKGKTIKVTVSITDDQNTYETATSLATTAVTTAPLTASLENEPDSHGGQSDFTFELRFSEELFSLSYATLRDHAFNVSGGQIRRAQRADKNSIIRNVHWRITVRPDGDGDVIITLPETTSCSVPGAICTQDERVLSNSLSLTVSGPEQANSPASGAPVISGAAQVGEALTADTTGITDGDGLTNVSYSYQWIRNDGNADSDIAGATASTYELAAADRGMTIKVQVNFTDDRSNDESLTSDPTSVVVVRPNSPASGAPVISGAAQVGETLTADTTGITDGDGLTNVSYSYRWIRNDGNADSDIAGATASTYELADTDRGLTIKVQVNFTDDRGNVESLTSTAVGPVSTAPDTAPTVSDTSQFRNHDATVGEAFSLTLPAADADSGNGGPYEYRLWHRGQPENFMDQAINGLRFDPATRTLAGTPEESGLWLLSYVVHDGDDNRSVEDRFRARTNLQVTVSAPQDTAPTVSDNSQFRNHDATVGEAFSLTLPAADAGSGNGGPYEYRLWHRGQNTNFMDQAINGLRFDPATRTLAGTPEEPGVWLLSYVVHDNDDNRSVEDRFRARTNLQLTVSAE